MMKRLIVVHCVFLAVAFGRMLGTTFVENVPADAAATAAPVANTNPGNNVVNDRWEERGTQVVLKQVAVGFSREVYGLSLEGHILSFDRRTGNWSRLEPEVVEKRKTIAVSCDSFLWAVGEDGTVMRRPRGVTSGWETVGTHKDFATLAVGRGYDVWGTTVNGTVRYFLATTNDFFTTTKNMSSVAVSCTGDVWGVNKDAVLEQYVEGQWHPRASGIRQVEARNFVYALGQRRSLWLVRVPPVGKENEARNFWHNMNWKADSFSLGPDETLWSVDAAGKPWMHKGENMEATMGNDLDLQMKQGGEWLQVRGSAGVEQVCSGMLGELYGVTKEGKIKRFDKDRPDTWEDIPAPPSVVRIGCGCDGLSLWAVTADSTTHRYNGNGRWTKFSERLDSISIGMDQTEVYGIKKEARYVVKYNPKDNRWIKEEVRGSLLELMSISAGCDRTVWGVNLDGQLVGTGLHQPSLWTTHGEGARAVSVGKEVYILDEKDFLFQYRAAGAGEVEGKHNWKFMFKQLKTLSANQHGEIYGVNLENVLVRFRPMQFPVRSGSWRELEVAPVAQISISNLRHIYAIDKYNVVLRFGSSNQWVPMEGGVTLRQISAACDGTVWGIQGKDSLWRLPNPDSEWERVTPLTNENSVHFVAVGRREDVWGINANGLAVRWHTGRGVWELDPFQVDEADPFVHMSVGCDGSVWAVGESGIVYKRIGKRGVGEAAAWIIYFLDAVEVQTGYRTFVIDKEHNLWKFEAEKRGRKPMDKWVKLGPMVHVATAADGTTWGVGRQGRVIEIAQGKPEGGDPLPLPVVPPVPSPVIHAPQPDNQALSPFIAGTREDARIKKPVADPDDVTTLIKEHMANLDFKRLAEQRSPYNPYETERETFGNSLFKVLDEETVEEARKKYPKQRGSTFKNKPPF